VNAVTAKLCGATGEKSMFVTAPNSFIWTGACGRRNKGALLRMGNRYKQNSDTTEILKIA